MIGFFSSIYVQFIGLKPHFAIFVIFLWHIIQKNGFLINKTRYWRQNETKNKYKSLNCRKWYFVLLFAVNPMPMNFNSLFHDMYFDYTIRINIENSRFGDLPHSLCVCLCIYFVISFFEHFDEMMVWISSGCYKWFLTKQNQTKTVYRYSISSVNWTFRLFRFVPENHRDTSYPDHLRLC